jgi:hypothetical protein
MASEEVRQVLANWIGRAVSPSGRLPDETDPLVWVADRFGEWWRERVEEPLLDAERAASGIKSELERLGGWDAFGEALHELIHLGDALADLRSVLGLEEVGPVRGESDSGKPEV